MSGLIDILLEPPAVCQASPDMKMIDRRKGALWYCPLVARLVGKGRKKPPCRCADALRRARSAGVEVREVEG